MRQVSGIYHVTFFVILSSFIFSVLSYAVKFSDDPSGRRKLWNRTEALTASGIPRSPDLWLGFFFPTSPIIAFLWPLLPPKAFLISQNNIFTPTMYYVLCFPHDFSNNKCLLILTWGKAFIFLEKLSCHRNKYFCHLTNVIWCLKASKYLLNKVSILTVCRFQTIFMYAFSTYRLRSKYHYLKVLLLRLM